MLGLSFLDFVKVNVGSVLCRICEGQYVVCPLWILQMSVLGLYSVYFVKDNVDLFSVDFAKVGVGSVLCGFLEG